MKAPPCARHIRFERTLTRGRGVKNVGCCKIRGPTPVFFRPVGPLALGQPFSHPSVPALSWHRHSGHETHSPRCAATLFVHPSLRRGPKSAFTARSAPGSVGGRTGSSVHIKMSTASGGAAAANSPPTAAASPRLTSMRSNQHLRFLEAITQPGYVQTGRPSRTPRPRSPLLLPWRL